jgi:DNA-binding NarL/FixJ family response regulator
MIKERFPATDVIMLTMHSKEDYLLDSISAGALGYISKEFSSSQLLQAIKAVSRGESLVDPNNMNKMFMELKKLLEKRTHQSPDNSGLTEREIEILRLIEKGNTNRDIGDKLCLSTHTIRNHIANIFVKLGCNSRTKAVFEGRKQQLI